MANLPAPDGLIDELIFRSLSGNIQLHPFEIELVKTHHALPIYGDFLGFFMLTPNGDVAFLPDDENATLRIVEAHATESRFVHVALAQAGYKYPELAPYCPERPSDALVYASCNGTGKIPEMPEHIICECGGTGWIPSTFPADDATKVVEVKDGGGKAGGIV